MAATLKLSQVQLGDSADQTKNFVLSVPDVPDGTLTIKWGNGTPILNVSASGIITGASGGVLVGNGPCFRVVHTAGQIIANATDTVVLFNDKTVSVRGFDTEGAYAVATGRFNPKTPGYYQINATIILGASGITTGSAALQYNGNAVQALGTLFVDFTGLPYAFSGGTLLYLDGVNDYVDVTAFIAASSDRSVMAGSSFSAFLARAA